jgi:hypothetical protein
MGFPAKSAGSFVILAPDVVAPIQSITASSVMGWGGFVFSLIACGVLVWDRVVGKGKAVASLDGKIEHLCEQIDHMEGRLTVVDGLTTTVRELVFEWRGVDGNNGYKSIIRENQRRITEIEKRNWQIDAVREAHEADLRRSGGKQRRESDRPLNNLLPEDREERG